MDKKRQIILSHIPLFFLSQLFLVCIISLSKASSLSLLNVEKHGRELDPLWTISRSTRLTEDQRPTKGINHSFLQYISPVDKQLFKALISPFPIFQELSRRLVKLRGQTCTLSQIVDPNSNKIAFISSTGEVQTDPNLNP